MSPNKFDTAYISSSCNLTPCSADWGRNNLIAYGTCNATALCDTTKYGNAWKVISTLHTSKARVNAVCWIRTPDGSPEDYGVSGAADGTVVVWSRWGDERHALEGHTMPVTVVDGLQMSVTRQSIVVSASADSTVKIWRSVSKDNAECTDYQCAQTLSLGYGICLCVRLCLLPGTESLLLACAMDDSTVQLYTGSRDQDGFIKVDTLSGHEDWVRALDFVEDDDGDVLLASGSQDCSVRLWRVSACKKQHSQGGEIRAERRVFQVDGGRHSLTVALESVLAGHEGRVYGVSWHPALYHADGTKVGQPMKLLTCSMDKSMIVWTPHAECGVWLDSVRVGDVGGNTLGFYGCKFAPDGRAVMAHGYQGAFHLWKYSEERDAWEAGVTCGGHFGEVVDVGWDPRGQFLISASADQTTRLHAPWTGARGAEAVSWHEIARPQVHGFDMTCLAVISSSVYASGAEEKVIRTFAAPRTFVANFARLSNVVMDSASCTAQGASTPSLGLSNKAVYEGDAEGDRQVKHAKDQCPEGYFTAVDLTEPPSEDVLLQNTLWPEIQKLYGHGYEVYSLAARPDGRLLASACKATTPEHAAIILWETDGWREVQRLTSHTLTVTQMAFSPDGLSLLSVSRDRRWSLFVRDADNNTYTLSARSDKATGLHTRIVWCCAWTHDSRHFATGSREGRLVLWGRDGSSISTFFPAGDDAVTSVAFAPVPVRAGYLAALGTHSGLVLLYSWSQERPEHWTQCVKTEAHHLAVKRVAFRPVTGHQVLQLASCGADHAVKIHDVNVDLLQ